MPHEVYDVAKSVTIDDGDFSQTGDGIFQGFRYQRGMGYNQNGRGVLGVLGKAWRYILPFVKKNIVPVAKEALKAVTNEGLETGSKVLSDMAQGRDPKEAVVTEGTQALKKLIRKAGQRMQQSGSGRKRIKARGSSKNPRSISNLHAVGRSVLNSSAKRGRRHTALALY